MQASGKWRIDEDKLSRLRNDPVYCQLRRRTRARRRQSPPNQKHHSIKKEVGYLWGKLRQDLSFKSCSLDPITGPSIVHHRLTWKGKSLDPPQQGTLLPKNSSLRPRPPPVPPTICITMPYTNCIMYILRMERRVMERRTMTDGNGTTWGNWTEGEKKLKQIDLLLASPREVAIIWTDSKTIRTIVLSIIHTAMIWIQKRLLVYPKLLTCGTLQVSLQSLTRISTSGGLRMPPASQPITNTTQQIGHYLYSDPSLTDEHIRSLLHFLDEKDENS